MEVLFLHGFGGCEMIASLQIAGLRQLGWNVRVLEGFIPLTRHDIETGAGLDDNMRKNGLAGTIRLTSWYPVERKGDMNWPRAYADVEQARDRIVEHVVSLGGVDGIVGFSQGASMAILCAEAAERINARCERQLRFVAGFSPGPTVFITRGHDIAEGACAGLLAFLCSGEADSVGGAEHLPVMEKKLVGGGAKAVVHKWAGGHKMPPPEDDAYERLRDATDELLTPMQRFCMAIGGCLGDVEEEPRSRPPPSAAPSRGRQSQPQDGGLW
jgi:predicted esterase